MLKDRAECALSNWLLSLESVFLIKVLADELFIWANKHLCSHFNKIKFQVAWLANSIKSKERRRERERDFKVYLTSSRG